jgi:acyl-coenzyme A synthetase/AMP-(fatty) acid ligase
VCVVEREDEERLVKPLAFVVPRAGFAAGEELAADLEAHLKRHLAPHEYPRRFEWRESLPENDRGKMSRKELDREVEARGR